MRKQPTPIRISMSVVTLFAVGCAGGPLTTREKGAGIGALGGAASTP
jgi:hypothetical protein